MQTFKEIYEAILNDGFVEQPLKKFGIEGVDATTIEIICHDKRYADKRIIIGDMDKHSPNHKNIIGDVFFSEDENYMMYLSTK